MKLIFLCIFLLIASCSENVDKYADDISKLEKQLKSSRVSTLGLISHSVKDALKYQDRESMSLNLSQMRPFLNEFTGFEILVNSDVYFTDGVKSGSKISVEIKHEDEYLGELIGYLKQ